MGTYIKEEIWPLAATHGSVKRHLVMATWYQTIHAQQILDDFLFALGVLEVQARLTVAAD